MARKKSDTQSDPVHVDLDLEQEGDLFDGDEEEQLDDESDEEAEPELSPDDVLADVAAANPKAAAPAEAARAAAPRSSWKPKKGAACRYTYMRNGPTFHAAPAKVVAVHADGTLDLDVEMPGGHTNRHLSVRPARGPEDPNSWSPPA